MFDKTRFKEEVMGKKNSALTFIGTLQFLSQFFGNLYHRFLLFYIGRLVTMLEEILVPILIGIMINQIVYYKNFSVFYRLVPFFFLYVLSLALFIISHMEFILIFGLAFWSAYGSRYIPMYYKWKQNRWPMQIMET